MKGMLIGLFIGLILLVFIFLGSFGLALYFSWAILGSYVLTAVVLSAGTWFSLEVFLRFFGHPPHLVQFYNFKTLDPGSECYQEARVYCRGDTELHAGKLARCMLSQTAKKMGIVFDPDYKVKNIFWTTYLLHPPITIINHR